MRISVYALVSRVLIIIGAALIAVFVFYEAYNYPWRTVFSRDMPQEDAALPDPGPPVLPEGWSMTEYNWAASPDYGGIYKIDASALLASDWMLSPPYVAMPGFYKSDIVRLGTLKIPILGVAVNLFDGIGGQLSYGAAHAGGTALPGEEGNCVIAAARQYIKMRPFRHIDKLKAGDRIIISAGGGRFVYSVYESLVVTPYDFQVLDYVEEEPYALTLVTCTPVTNPKDRLVIRARLISR